MSARLTITLVACALAFAAHDCFAETIVGVHLGSAHMPDRGQQNVNPGLYVRVDNLQAGFYRNSYSRTGAYAGYVQPVGPVDLMVGAVYGYQHRCRDGVCSGFTRGAVAPMAALSYAVPIKVFGMTPRVWAMPGMKGHSSVAHASFEREFK